MDSKEIYHVTFESYLQPKRAVKHQFARDAISKNKKLFNNSEPIEKKPTCFEDFCKTSSMHGFSNFVDAKTWQRWLWSCLICVAGVTSALFLQASELFDNGPSTVHYITSMDLPAWPIPFPAVTICGFNRVSKKALKDVSKDSDMNATKLSQLLWQVDQNQTRLSDVVAPTCADQLLFCSWKGLPMKCNELFETVMTPVGICCAFNYHAIDAAPPRHTAACGRATGLTVVLDANVQDYAGALHPHPGFEITVHDTVAYPEVGLARTLVQTQTETAINVKPYSVIAHPDVRSQALTRRRCYFPEERALRFFRNYTQSNCLVECRQEMIYKKCGCVPDRLAFGRNSLWPLCNVSQANCLTNTNDIRSQMLEMNIHKSDPVRESERRFICDCYPLCQFYRFEFVADVGVIRDTYINVNTIKNANSHVKDSDLTVVHVFFGELMSEQLILYPLQRWLETLGLFGGITGLFMGCSFVSIFEILFFIFVRPTFSCCFVKRKINDWPKS